MATTHANPQAAPAAVTYPIPLSTMRARLRMLIKDELCRLTNNPKARMWWTAVHYAKGVVLRGRHKLIGWPTAAGIPFANLSDIPGGQPIMQYLLDRWADGTIRFVPANDIDIDLARRNPKAILPGVPPVLPAPRHWGPYGRNDIGKARHRPVTNPKGWPLRRRKDGAISPKLILDSDMEDDEELSSDVEEAAGETE
ncbi:hypothetical protein OH77DRAFT_1432293 [Trametes cingulata]|nr:hypothetical protein OH77DRAFT_1432293 [Trametes cingulata]